MPEGDTLHKVARALRPLLCGQRLLAAGVARGRAPLIVGLEVREVAVHGKHVTLALRPPGRAEGGFRLRVHLGMHGSWHRYAPGEAWRRPARQAQVRLEVEGHVVVCFNAEDVELWEADAPSERRRLEALGPDLLAAEVDLPGVVGRARRAGPATLLVDLLLDQRVAAGIGNVYKCELLFLHRLGPDAVAGRVGDDVLLALFASARRLMRQNLGDWRRTTTYDRRQGPRRQPRLFVYGRRGEPCLHCGAAIVQARLGRGRRSTYWCPACQAEGAPPAAGSAPPRPLTGPAPPRGRAGPRP